MKTLQQILKRNDYIRLSKELAEKAEELADEILAKMIELDIDELDNLEIINVSSNSGHEQNYLIIEGNPNSGILNICKHSFIGSNRSGFHFAGDFNCWVDFAENKEAILFVNNVNNYLLLLDKIETEKFEEIKKLLKS